MASVALVFVLAVGTALTGASARSVPRALAHVPRAEQPPPTGASPLLFIQNVGQFPQGARFQVWSGPGTVWLAEDAIWVTVVEGPHPSPRPPDGGHPSPLSQQERGEGPGEWGEVRGVNLRLTFPGANPHPSLEPFAPQDTVVSYFIGSAPEAWHPAVPVWGGVRYVDLYPGVDLEVTGEEGRWSWRLVVRPDGVGAHGRTPLQDVRLRVEGADGVELLPPPEVGREAGGEGLLLHTAVGDLVLPLLAVVQEDGTPLLLERGPQVQGDEVVSPFGPAGAAVSGPLSAAALDTPGDLLYATFLGGGGNDSGRGIAVDGAGAAYVTGETWSSDFPTTPGAFDPTYNGGQFDTFVAKMNAAGSGLIYAAFLGGGQGDSGSGIAVDRAGAAYVTGATSSSDFPTTAGAFDRTPNGGADAFVVKVNVAGSGLVYATFLGGSVWDEGYGIVVDRTGAAYVTGGTDSSDFPTTPGAFDQTYSGDCDAFVVKLNAAGSGLVYAAFLGGRAPDEGNGIAVDGTGAAYVTGDTWSAYFPGDFGWYGEDLDGFVVGVNAAGSGLVYCIRLSWWWGGHVPNGDSGRAIAVDGSGAAYIAGFTQPIDGSSDVFVVRVTGPGSPYENFLGGTGDEWASGIAVDWTGASYVTGWTASSDFPTTAGAYDRILGGERDAFVVKVNVMGSGLLYSTFLGGGHEDWGSDIAVDRSGALYVVGSTASSDFPTTAGAFDRTYNGGTDAFVVKLANPRPFWQALEAEWGTLTPPMTTATDALASACTYVLSSEREAGQVVLTFPVPARDTYYVFARGMGQGWGENSFWVSVDGGAETHWEIPQADGTWAWVWDRVLTVSLEPGVHTLRFRGREPNARLDRVEISNWLDYTPSVLPCAATPTPTATGTASPTSTPTGTPTPTATATGTPTPTATGTASPTGTPTDTSTPTATPTPTGTVTPTPTAAPWPGWIAGTVFVDLDRDSELDPGEPPLPGVTITVQRVDGTGPTHVTRTGQDGRYAVGGLEPGPHQVQETDPEGFYSISANTVVVVVQANETVVVDFADFPVPRVVLPLVLSGA